MKFRYYITDLLYRSIIGTDSENFAQDFSESEDYFVVDSETGEWLKPDSVRVPVHEIGE